MLVLTIKTDQPEAEIGLFQNENQLAYKKWQAHRQLSATIHKVIEELLSQAGKGWADIGGVIYFKGPGSFTGLRIGASVANSLASANRIIISSQNGDEWIQKGLKELPNLKTGVAIPEYGSEPHTTLPRK